VPVGWLLFSCDRLVSAGTTVGRLGSDGWVSLATALPFIPGAKYRLALSIDGAGAGGVRREVMLSPPGPARPGACAVAGATHTAAAAKGGKRR
jgi:hypothetical protein